MSDFSTVAPPSQQQSAQQPTTFNQSAAFAAALQRAKQVAAKINPDGRGNKRSLEDCSESDPKKLAANRPMLPPPVPLGLGLGGPTINEDIKVPDKMVGLIIGRGGEQITRLQAESGCKIQMAPDSQGSQDRICSLSGTKEAITRAKDLILNIVHLRGRNEGMGADPLDNAMNSMGGGGGQQQTPTPMPLSGAGNNIGGGLQSAANRNNFVEIMLPGPKVGLVIGKGGETIKQLQDKSGAKMIVIQDGPGQEQEKPLRISGDPMKVEYAKKLVYELLAEKEAAANFNNRRQGGPNNQQFGGSGSDGNNDFGGGGANTTESDVLVPRQAVGVVIGKGGDMIKKIQMETGAKVQFQQLRDEAPGDRRCYLAGTPKQVEQARIKIEELIDSVFRRDSEGGGARNRRNDNRFDGRPRNGQDYGGGGGGWDDRRQQQSMQQEVTFVVPSAKCGVIIGRGGDTIKQINQQSGAHCELDRRVQAPPNATEKTFVIRGDPEQVEAAKRIITDKIQLPLNFIITGGGGPMPTNLPTTYPGMAAQGYNPQSWGMPAYQQQWGAGAAANNGGPPGSGGSGPGMDGQNPANMQINPQTGQPDYSLQWAEYYRSLGMMREAEMIEQQAKTKGMGNAQPPQQQAQPPQQQMGGQPGAVPTAATNGGGQADYSAQWAEYYRSIGKHKEAEAIEAQMKAKAQQASGGGGAGPPAQSAVPAYQQQQPQNPQQQQYGAYQTPAGGYYGGQPQNSGGGQYGGFPSYGYGAQAASAGNPDN